MRSVMGEREAEATDDPRSLSRLRHQVPHAVGQGGLEMPRAPLAAGDTWYSYTGAWGAGSTYDVAHMRRIGTRVPRAQKARRSDGGARRAGREEARRVARGRTPLRRRIPYEDLLDVADVAQHWYDGQRDPVYALVSSTFAGHDTPLSIAEDALYNLNKDYRRSNDAESAKPSVS